MLGFFSQGFCISTRCHFLRTTESKILNKISYKKVKIFVVTVRIFNDHCFIYSA